MPTAFISRAEAAEQLLAYSGSPVAAIAIAPGLESNETKEGQRDATYNCVPA